MKTVAVIAAGAALAAAQGNSSLSSLPQCGQTCVTNLIGIVQQAPYNCPNNPTCFCCQANFGFGIRDCANESCASSTDANSAIAYAVSYCASALPTTSVCTSFSGGSSATASGSSASATAASPTGPAAFIQAINGGISGYSLASTTATAGGPEVTASGTEYSALPSDGGIVATASGLTTTIPPSGLTGAASSATGSAAGGAGPAGFIVPVDSGNSGYSIASTTITAGGPEATLSGTEYSALPSAGGVVATASGLTTTYAESALGGAAGASGSGVSGAGQTSPVSQSGSGSATGSAGASSGAASTTTTTTGGAGGAGGSGQASSTSAQGAGPIVTAAPVLLGAAALAVLAL